MDSARECASEMAYEQSVIQKSHDPNVQRLFHVRRLLIEEQQKITQGVNADWIDVESKITICKRVFLPQLGRNIVGRLIGIKGAKLKQICSTYKCSIGIFGAGSRRNPVEEAEFLRSGDPTHAHYAVPLHAEISIVGDPINVYARFGRVMELINKVAKTQESFEHDGIVFESTLEHFTNKANEQTSMELPPQQQSGQLSYKRVCRACHQKFESASINNYICNKEQCRARICQKCDEERVNFRIYGCCRHCYMSKLDAQRPAK